jgi:hypothetical protein
MQVLPAIEPTLRRGGEEASPKSIDKGEKLG